MSIFSQNGMISNEDIFVGKLDFDLSRGALESLDPVLSNALRILSIDSTIAALIALFATLKLFALVTLKRFGGVDLKCFKFVNCLLRMKN